MSRQKRDKDLFPNGMISEEAMLAYLQNSLSAEEMQQFEKLLKDDPFAQEALEGLQAAQNVPSVTKSIATVKKNVREKTGAKEGKVIQLHWSNYAWAAVVFGLLIGIGFLMVNYMGNKTDAIAQNTEKTLDAETKLLEGKEEAPRFESATADSMPIEQQTVTVTTDSVSYRVTNAEALTGKDNSGTFSTKVQEDVLSKPIAATGAAKQEEQKATAPVVAQNNQAGVKSVPAKNAAVGNEEASLKEGESKNLETVVVSSYKKEAKKDKNAGTAAASDANAAAKNNEADVTEAMKNFNAGDYEKSGQQFSTVLKKEPNNADALYFGGISDYINNTNAKGEKNFDKLLKSGSRYAEGSKWYKANILIQKGKTTEAKKLLNDLANSNSSYKERAVKKLAEMEF
jgi:tetratricopeptide (TPR) repeat protein